MPAARREASEFVIERPGPENEIPTDQSDLGVEVLVVTEEVQDHSWSHRAVDMAISPLFDEGFCAGLQLGRLIAV